MAVPSTLTWKKDPLETSEAPPVLACEPMENCRWGEEGYGKGGGYNILSFSLRLELCLETAAEAPVQELVKTRF